MPAENRIFRICPCLVDRKSPQQYTHLQVVIEMKIQWHGHSCFSLHSNSGFCAVTDPCDPGTGYSIHISNPDAVTLSHSHHDHNYLEAVSGNPQVIQKEGWYQVGDVVIQGFPSYHDDQKGALRGNNILFLYEIDHLRVLHLGDLGHIPSDTLIREIGEIDILLCPVGGIYTIDADQAVQVVKLFHPSVCIPMHYLTSALRFSLAPVDPFLELAKAASIPARHLESSIFDSEKGGSFPGNPEIIVLDFAS